MPKFEPAKKEDVITAIEAASKDYPKTSYALAKVEAAELLKDRLDDYRYKLPNAPIKQVIDLAGKYYSAVVECEMESDFKLKSDAELEQLRERCSSLLEAFTNAVKAANKAVSQAGLQPLTTIENDDYGAFGGRIVTAFFIVRRK